MATPRRKVTLDSWDDKRLLSDRSELVTVATQDLANQYIGRQRLFSYISAAAVRPRSLLVLMAAIPCKLARTLTGFPRRASTARTRTGHRAARSYILSAIYLAKLLNAVTTRARA